ncbi:GDP-mannose 4,6-dehydratase [Patescibacteria group bacterium]|nr:GDP-mannose 4,6-dehydratase [Patescibacteria group bacterium]
MKVLVSGGSGFIGSHLVDTLVAAGHEVIVVDHHKRKKRRFPNPAATLHKMSFHHPALSEIFRLERPDAVCHLAAQISVTHSVADPIMDAQTNIVNSVALLDLARKSGCKTFIFASSGGAIYGDHEIRPTPEVFDSAPLSPYGVGKQSFEHYLDFYRKHHAMRSAVLRFSNVYGPRQFSGGEASVISIFINKLISGDPAVIFGDGSATRDYLYVADAVDALAKTLESSFNGVVNVSSGEEISVVELWKKLKAIHGQDHPVEFHQQRTGEVQRSCLSTTLAKEKLGWQPKTSLEEGLRKTYEWFKTN